MKNELFEQGMAKFLKSITEQIPPTAAPGAPIPATTPLATPGQPLAGQQPYIPLTGIEQPGQQPAEVPEQVATGYLDTRRLFYTKPPTDSSDWVNEIRANPQYRPLTNRIVPYLDSVFGKSFVVQRAGAARYSPNQFRISLRGSITAPTTLKYENGEIKVLSISVPGLHAKQMVIKDPVKANAEPLSFKPKEPTPEEAADAAGAAGAAEYKTGEEVSKKDIDTMIGQFAESKIFEVRLAQPEKQVKAGAWSKLEEPFRKWFMKQVVQRNPKSFVDHHMSTKEGRESIKQEFIKYAENTPKIDKEALSTWAGKEKPEAAKKEKPVAKEPEAKEPEAIREVPDKIRNDKRFDDIVGTARNKENLGLNKKEAEGFAGWIINSIDPESDEDIVKSVMSKKNYKDFKESEHKMASEERLEIFLRKILVEAKKQSSQKGTMGTAVANLTTQLNNIVDDWMDNNSLVSKKGGDIKSCDIQFMTANDLRFETHKLMSADGESPQKEWNAEDPIQIVGNMIIKANVLVDARLQANGKTWEFRTFDNHNNPLVKRFGILGRDKEQRRHKISSTARAELGPSQRSVKQKPATPAIPATGG